MFSHEHDVYTYWVLRAGQQNQFMRSAVKLQRSLFLLLKQSQRLAEMPLTLDSVLMPLCRGGTLRIPLFLGTYYPTFGRN